MGGIKIMISIYLAGALFDKHEIRRLHEVSKHLRDIGYEVYSPVEHKVDGADNMSNSYWARAVYEEDIKAIKECDIVVAIYDGLISDSGTAWEIGFAYGIGKNVVVAVDDNIAEVISLMVVNCADRVICLRDLMETINIFECNSVVCIEQK